MDNRPDLRGVNACERLTEADIPCSYVYINSATYVMKDQVRRVEVLSGGFWFVFTRNVTYVKCNNILSSTFQAL